MRFKPVPEPPAALDGVERAKCAVPLVPGGEEDCCARLGRRLDCSRDEARRWLTFLRALGLVREADEGFVRTDQPVNRDDLAAAFREQVLGARELLDTLDSDTTETERFEAVAAAAPRWERGRGDFERRWRERTDRLAGWAALLGLGERPDVGTGI